MRFRFLFLITGLAVLLSACNGSDPQITPAKDKLTFLFFYTDGWNPWANMASVVNGLENVYIDQVDFRRIDANSQEGKDVFDTYGLRGHPSYVLINPGGLVLWKGLGEQPEEKLIQVIQEVLSDF